MKYAMDLFRLCWNKDDIWGISQAKACLKADFLICREDGKTGNNNIDQIETAKEITALPAYRLFYQESYIRNKNHLCRIAPLLI